MNGVAAAHVVLGQTGRVCRGPVNLSVVPGFHSGGLNPVALPSTTNRSIQDDAAGGKPQMTCCHTIS